jgi:predicted DNA-binding protein YlxM (UPF0122 family)
MSSGKTEVPGIYKVREGILINTDNQALAAYKNKKRREQMVDQMNEDMQSVKDDIREIKDLLKGLAGR